MERDISDLQRKKEAIQCNAQLDKIQHTELETLNNDNSVVIQSVDKGGALVILDKDAYNQEIVRKLRNYTFFRKLHGNPITQLKTKVHGCLNDLLERGEMTQHEHSFMLVNSPITPVFYTLPKYIKTY